MDQLRPYKHFPPDHLAAYRDNYPPNTPEHQKAKAEIEWRANEEATRLEASRHVETTALSREEIDASHYSNRLSIAAIVIAVFALLVAGLSLFLQWRQKQAATPAPRPHTPLALRSNTAPAVALPLTNAPPTNPAALPNPKPQP